MKYICYQECIAMYRKSIYLCNTVQDSVCVCVCIDTHIYALSYFYRITAPRILGNININVLYIISKIYVHTHTHSIVLYVNTFLLFLGHTLGVWKFPGQGSNPCHLHQCTNARLLTHLATWKLPCCTFGEPLCNPVCCLHEGWVSL